MSNKTPMTFDQAASFGVVGMVAHQPAMSTSDTPTPRTDAAQNTGCWTNDTDYYVEAEFARQLERELTAAQAQIAELETQLEAHAWKVSPAMAQAKIEHLIAHSARVQDANDRLTLQVTELERDKARLDWLEAGKGRCGYSDSLYVGEGFFAHEHTQGDKYHASTTLRAAIDAAIDQAMSEANEPNTFPHA